MHHVGASPPTRMHRITHNYTHINPITHTAHVIFTRTNKLTAWTADDEMTESMQRSRSRRYVATLLTRQLCSRRRTCIALAMHRHRDASLACSRRRALASHGCTHTNTKTHSFILEREKRRVCTTRKQRNAYHHIWLRSRSLKYDHFTWVYML